MKDDKSVLTKAKLRKILRLLDKVSDGIEEYAETLETTDVIRDPLDDIYNIIEEALR